MFKNKKISIIVSSITVILLLLTGTLAWRQTVSKTNEFIGRKPGDITLHDDFDPKTGAKDIYVENNSTNPVFVRVMLGEAMNLTDNEWRPKDDAEYVAHTYETDLENCLHTNLNGEAFHDYFEWTMGGQKFYMPGDGSEVVSDTTVYYGGEQGVKETPTVSFIKAADYLALEPALMDAFQGWIYDTDGYAYWSQPLGKGEVTGLLLHHVAVQSSIEDTDYYYAIKVTVEAVDEADLPMWLDGQPSVDNSGTKYTPATEDGKQVIVNIANQIPTAAPIAP